VPHSHMDAGWLFPVDYYYEQGVRHILTSVTEWLVDHQLAKYTIGDIYFFRRWFL